MKGSRKFVVVLLYMAAVTFIAWGVLHYGHDSLMGAGTWAAGMASGVAAFMWGNAREHASKQGDDAAK